jgi:hypothetical protein
MKTMEQAPARSNKTTTYIASGTLIFATLSLFSNIMIGLPVMAAIALGGFITARQVPKSFDLLKKDLKHLAGSFCFAYQGRRRTFQALDKK